MDRRTLLALLPAVALAPALLSLAPPTEEAFAQGVDPNAILNDPEAPISGNPKGDLTIVAFLDYNCPFCKKAEPDLTRLVKADGRIRLVHKDWPILGDASVYGAQLALAAKYQGRYDAVHRALMAIPGRKIPKERMLEAVSASGVDMARLEADRTSHQGEIAALLQRADQVQILVTAFGLLGHREAERRRLHQVVVHHGGGQVVGHGHQQRVAHLAGEPPGLHQLVERNLDVHLAIGAVHPAGVVNGIGEHAPPGQRKLDPPGLGEPQIAALAHHLDAQFVAVDAHRVVGAVAHIGVRLARRLDVGADAAVPQQVHRGLENEVDQLVGGERGRPVEAECGRGLLAHRDRLRAA